MKNRIFSLILSVALLITLALFALPASGAAYGETLNLANVQANQKGDGYFWNNMTSTLTLDGFELSTSADFGMKLPEGATVELVGTNKISGGKYGIGCPGSVTFTGNGTLVAEGGTYAVYSYTANENHKLRFDGGKLFLKGGVDAVFSESAVISVTGSSLELKAGDGHGIKGRVIASTGGSVVSDAPIHATHEVSISRTEIEVSGRGKAAITSDNILKLENVKILTGSNADSLNEKDVYSGEVFLQTVPISESARGSILFGEGTPITVDYLLLTAAVILIACALVLPILHRKNKVKKMYASLSAENSEEKK